MPAATPEPDPEERPGPDEPQPRDECGGPPRFTWLPGSEDDGHKLSGPVPPEALPGDQQAGPVPAELDWQALLNALASSGMLDGDPENQDRELADEWKPRGTGGWGRPWIRPSSLP